MTNNEQELLSIIRNSDSPSNAIVTATKIILSFLTQHESSAGQVPAVLQAHA